MVAPDSIQSYLCVPITKNEKTSVGPNDNSKFVDICERVENSGVPNYLGLREEISSKFQLHEWERRLKIFDDKQIIDFLKFGWPLSFEGVLDFCDDLNVTNHKGATEFSQDVDKYINSELREGRIIGPFKKSPFQGPVKISPLNTVPKKDSTERRVILDLSFPIGRSVNDGINKGQYLGEVIELKLPKVDEFSKLICKKGIGCLMFKRDLKKAYRQINIDPKDVRKVGFRWKNQIFMDNVVPMGSRTGAYICQRTTNAIRFMYEHSGFQVINYIDDFAGAETVDKASEAFSFLGHLLKVLGVKESEDKSCAPSTEMSFLGILFNSVKMTMEVEPDRLHKLLLLLPTWLHKSHATRKEVESLIGLLSFVAKCVRPARIFLSRTLDFMKGLPKSGRFSIPTEFMLDVRWWYRFVAQYNGVSIIPPSHWSAVNSVIETDACLSGGGGVNFETRECFQFEFPSELRNNTQASINEYELLTIMVAVKVWGSSLRGKKVRVNCDNTTAVAAMNLARLHNKFSQAIMREISYWSAVGEFEVMTMHISGLRNIVADTLSRTHLSVQSRIKMESLVRELGLKVVVVPNEAFEFTGQWV